jgi:hypothetical protein
MTNEPEDYFDYVFPLSRGGQTVRYVRAPEDYDPELHRLVAIPKDAEVHEVFVPDATEAWTARIEEEMRLCDCDSPHRAGGLHYYSCASQPHNRPRESHAQNALWDANVNTAALAPCPACRDTEDAAVPKCETCGGSGENPGATTDDERLHTGACPTCRGTGDAGLPVVIPWGLVQPGDTVVRVTGVLVDDRSKRRIRRWGDNEEEVDPMPPEVIQAAREIGEWADPCWFDHHGNCQEHYVAQPPCPWGVLREWAQP